MNKIDTLSPREQWQIEDALRRQFPRSRVMPLSAKEGTGIDAWLDALAGPEVSGRTVTDVDYDVYAEGEAALGWLNAAYELEADAGGNWDALARSLVTALRDAFREARSELAHLKIHLKAGPSSLVANLTTSGGEPSVRGSLVGSPRSARLLLNVRAHIAPDRLRGLVERVIAEQTSASVHVRTEKLECFAPSRPVPTHRYAAVV